MTKVAVLTGGSTAERDVAFAGAAQVVASLRRSGYDVAVVDTVNGSINRDDEHLVLTPRVSASAPDPAHLANWRSKELATDAIRSPEVTGAALVFIVLHGEQGEGGGLQLELDALGATYTGSGPSGSANAMDKNLAKSIMRDVGIPTPDWVMWTGSNTDYSNLGFPLIVKPSRVGSTLGLSVVKNAGEIDLAVTEALRYDSDVMFESFVSGREFTVGVLGDRVLAVGEIIPEHEIFDYECKYTPGMSQEIFPARISGELEQNLRNLALEVHQALGLRHFSRIDFLESSEGIFCLEANTLPGMTQTSLLPQSAGADGIDFDSLCREICTLALPETLGNNPSPPTI